MKNGDSNIKIDQVYYSFIFFTTQIFNKKLYEHYKSLMEANLQNLRVKDLRQIARDLGIKNYSLYDKRGLVKYIIKNAPKNDLLKELQNFSKTRKADARPRRKTVNRKKPPPTRIRYKKAPIYFAPAPMAGIMDQPPALTTLLRQMDIKTIIKFCASSSDMRALCASLPDIQYRIRKEKTFKEGLNFVTDRDIKNVSINRKLSSFVLSNFRIILVPEEIQYLTYLTMINLSHNFIVTLPEEIGNLTNLTELKLNNNNIVTLPDSIGNLVNLEQLNLNHNQLTTLPATINNLISLQTLLITNNHFVTLPPELYELPVLGTLHIEGNQIDSLDPEIADLPLHTFIAYLNRFTSFPTALTNIIFLERLSLGNNRLVSIPPTIDRLTNLSELYISHGQIESLPSSIGRLTNLTILRIIDNNLETLPSDISNLSKLQELKINNNQLIQLPTNIGQLGDLNILLLKNNHLTFLPGSFTQLTRLNILDLRGNPFISINPPLQIFLDSLIARGATVRI